MNRISAALLVGLAVACAGCDGPTKPTAPAPTVSCPAPVSGLSPDGNPVAVTFGTPTVTGGEAPVTTTCAPASGSSFAVGSTTVMCTARDARQQSASCSFAVSVTKTPHLAATRFVAFGDSITEGFTHTCPGTVALKWADFLRDVQGLRPPPDSPISYPNKLKGLLAGRYLSQSFTMINEGNGGEFISDGAADLGRVLAQDLPEVLLLQEGTNDMNAIGFGGDPEAQMNLVVSKLREMIRTARARAVLVFVGTLTPQRPGACRGYAPAYIGPVNDRIRGMVAGEDARLADLYSAYGGVASDLIGPDGLHPSEAGYQKIAETFFDVIKSRLEN